jgi:hypothetical protein
VPTSIVLSSSYIVVGRDQIQVSCEAVRVVELLAPAVETAEKAASRSRVATTHSVFLPENILNILTLLYSAPTPENPHRRLIPSQQSRRPRERDAPALAGTAAS